MLTALPIYTIQTSSLIISPSILLYLLILIPNLISQVSNFPLISFQLTLKFRIKDSPCLSPSALFLADHNLAAQNSFIKSCYPLKRAAGGVLER